MPATIYHEPDRNCVYGPTHSVLIPCQTEAEWIAAPLVTQITRDYIAAGGDVMTVPYMAPELERVTPLRPLGTNEQFVLHELAIAFNAFAALPESHPHDADEFMRAIHAAQNIVLARPATEAEQRRRQHGQGQQDHEAPQAAAGGTPDPPDEAADTARDDRAG